MFYTHSHIGTSNYHTHLTRHTRNYMAIFKPLKSGRLNSFRNRSTSFISFYLKVIITDTGSRLRSVVTCAAWLRFRIPLARDVYVYSRIFVLSCDCKILGVQWADSSSKVLYRMSERRHTYFSAW